MNAHSAEKDVCACGPDECLNAGAPGCYFGEVDEVKEAAWEDATWD